jgi:hypothetical protein
MRIPVTLAAEFRGLARTAGRFTNEQGREVEYTEAYKFETVDADGVLGEVVLSQKVCDEAADFDVAKLEPGTVLTIAGVVADGEGGMYVKPLKITKGLAQVKAA